MTYRIKVPPRSLPVDEAHLLSGLERLVLSLRDYRRPLLVGLSMLIVAGGIVGGVLWYDTQTAATAQALEREATLHYLTRPADDPKKADSNLREAIALFRKVAAEYPRTPAGPLALFHLGNALVQANELEGAIEAYKRFLLMLSLIHI